MKHPIDERPVYRSYDDNLPGLPLMLLVIAGAVIAMFGWVVFWWVH